MALRLCHISNRPQLVSHHFAAFPQSEFNERIGRPGFASISASSKLRKFLRQSSNRVTTTRWNTESIGFRQLRKCNLHSLLSHHQKFCLVNGRVGTFQKSHLYVTKALQHHVNFNLSGGKHPNFVIKCSPTVFMVVSNHHPYVIHM